MENSDFVRCKNCGKEIYWFELGDASKQICNDCIEKKYEHPVLYWLEKFKRIVVIFSGKKIDSKRALYIIFSYVWGISIIGTVICGILECFGIRTGMVGGIICLIIILPLPLFVLFHLLRYVIKKIYPEYDKDRAE